MRLKKHMVAFAFERYIQTVCGRQVTMDDVVVLKDKVTCKVCQRIMRKEDV